MHLSGICLGCPHLVRPHTHERVLAPRHECRAGPRRAPDRRGVATRKHSDRCEPVRGDPGHVHGARVRTRDKQHRSAVGGVRRVRGGVQPRVRAVQREQVVNGGAEDLGKGGARVAAF
jgi:hypothetical protein